MQNFLSRSDHYNSNTEKMFSGSSVFLWSLCMSYMMLGMNIGLFSFTLSWNVSFPFNISAVSVDVVVTDFDTKRERPRGSAWENTAERDLNHMLSASVSLVFPSHICSSFSARMHAEQKVSALQNPLGGRLQTTALHCIKSGDRVVDKLEADEGVFCTNE